MLYFCYNGTGSVMVEQYTVNTVLMVPYSSSYSSIVLSLPFGGLYGSTTSMIIVQV